MEILLSVTLLALAGALSPGPNNFIVMTVASRGELRKVLVAIAAIISGTLLLILLVWAGLGLLINQHPNVQSTMMLVGMAYLFWMGMSLIKSASKSDLSGNDSSKNGLPDSFIGISVFQLLNPKAWVFMTSMATLLSQEFGTVASLGIQAGIFTPVSVFSLGIWAALGRGLSSKLENDGYKRRFNIAMGLLLALPAAYLAFQALSAQRCYRINVLC